MPRSREATPDEAIGDLLVLSLRQDRATKAYEAASKELHHALLRRGFARRSGAPRRVLDRQDKETLAAVDALDDAITEMRACGLGHQIPEEPS